MTVSAPASSRAAQAIAALSWRPPVVARFALALAEVLTLHSPCDHPTAHCTACWTAWPCPTARTVLNTVET